MNKEKIIKLSEYFFDKITGTFTGFVIGLWAASLVSHFFATRSIKNLWGLASKKTVVDKQTYSILEWAASVLIGYIVFEIVVRVIRKRLDPWFEIQKVKFRNWILNERFRTLPDQRTLDTGTGPKP
jgi:hypothetical protein